MEERLEDNSFLRLSSSLYFAENERDKAKLADMEDFFEYRGVQHKTQHLNISTLLDLIEALAEDTLAECLRNDGVGVDCLDYGEHFLRLVLTREDDE